MRQGVTAHTDALIALAVADRRFRIDPDGSVWRVLFASRHGLRPCTPRRVDSPGDGGYARVTINSATVVAHRLIWVVAHGAIPAGMEINHRNGQKLDNRLENLELVTREQNIRHALRTGLMRPVTGERHPLARYSDATVAEIVRLKRSGMSNAAVGRVVGVSHAYVSRVWLGDIRADVSGIKRAA